VSYRNRKLNNFTEGKLKRNGEEKWVGKPHCKTARGGLFASRREKKGGLSKNKIILSWETRKILAKKTNTSENVLNVTKEGEKSGVRIFLGKKI